MLQIRLSKQTPDTGGAAVAKPHVAVETVTVACPDHLVLADLPVAKGIGAATTATTVKTVGRRSRRLLGERVHFCVRCDFPIAIYGRLSPCEHAFCLNCSRSDSICYLCDERIQKIQTIKLMEGIFICAAPHCLKSFLKRAEFESHIHESHSNLLQPNADKEDVNQSEVQSSKQPTTSDSRAFPWPLVHSGSNSQLLDSEEKAQRQQPREVQPLQKPFVQQRPPFFGQPQNIPPDNHPDSSRPPGFDWPGHNPLQQPMQGGSQQESASFAETQMPDYPPHMHSMQPPNFSLPKNTNPPMAPQFGAPPFQSEGAPPFYGSTYELGQMARPDSGPPEAGADQSSLFGFPPPGPGPMAGMSFMPNYPQPWNAGPPPSGPHGGGDSFTNPSDSPGNPAFYQGDYGRDPGVRPVMPGAAQGNSTMDPRDSRGLSAPRQQYPHTLPPPPPLPHSTQHQQRGKYYSGDRSHESQEFGWQHENRDSYGSAQD